MTRSNPENPFSPEQIGLLSELTGLRDALSGIAKSTPLRIYQAAIRTEADNLSLNIAEAWGNVESGILRQPPGLNPEELKSRLEHLEQTIIDARK